MSKKYTRNLIIESQLQKNPTKEHTNSEKPQNDFELSLTAKRMRDFSRPHFEGLKRLGELHCKNEGKGSYVSESQSRYKDMRKNELAQRFRADGNKTGLNGLCSGLPLDRCQDLGESSADSWSVKKKCRVLEKTSSKTQIKSVNPVSFKNKGKNRKKRKDSSLKQICTAILTHFLTQKKDVIRLNDFARDLGVERRRIYDIINVLEGFDVIWKRGKNLYQWRGLQGFEKNLSRLESAGDAIHETKVFTFEHKDPRLKKKSLTFLSIKLLKLFIVYKENINFKELIKLFGQKYLKLNLNSNDQDLKRSENKNKIRRLYDIVNVFKSLGLICKTTSASGRSVFQFRGLPGLRSNVDDLVSEAQMSSLGGQSEASWPDAGLSARGCKENFGEKKRNEDCKGGKTFVMKKKEKLTRLCHLKLGHEIEVRSNFSAMKVDNFSPMEGYFHNTLPSHYVSKFSKAGITQPKKGTQKNDLIKEICSNLLRKRENAKLANICSNSKKMTQMSQSWVIERKEPMKEISLNKSLKAQRRHSFGGNARITSRQINLQSHKVDLKNPFLTLGQDEVENGPKHLLQKPVTGDANSRKSVQVSKQTNHTRSSSKDSLVQSVSFHASPELTFACRTRDQNEMCQFSRNVGTKNQTCEVVASQSAVMGYKESFMGIFDGKNNFYNQKYENSRIEIGNKRGLLGKRNYFFEEGCVFPEVLGVRKNLGLKKIAETPRSMRSLQVKETWGASHGFKRVKSKENFGMAGDCNKKNHFELKKNDSQFVGKRNHNLELKNMTFGNDENLKNVSFDPENVHFTTFNPKNQQYPKFLTKITSDLQTFQKEPKYNTVLELPFKNQKIFQPNGILCPKPIRKRSLPGTFGLADLDRETRTKLLPFLKKSKNTAKPATEEAMQMPRFAKSDAQRRFSEQRKAELRRKAREAGEALSRVERGGVSVGVGLLLRAVRVLALRLPEMD